MTIIEAAKQASQPGSAMRRTAWEEGRWARWRGTPHERDLYVEDWLDKDGIWLPHDVYAMFLFSREDLLADDWEVKF